MLRRPRLPPRNFGVRRLRWHAMYPTGPRSSVPSPRRSIALAASVRCTTRPALRHPRSRSTAPPRQNGDDCRPSTSRASSGPSARPCRRSNRAAEPSSTPPACTWTRFTRWATAAQRRDRGRRSVPSHPPGALHHRLDPTSERRGGTGVSAMRQVTITQVEAQDRRYQLHEGAGSDVIHSGAEYAFAVTRLRTDTTVEGCGITLTLGRGNRLVCDAIEQLGRSLAGREIEEMMAEFGTVSRRLADDPALRWLGPHKGVVHLALASLVNACFDLWAKARGVPLWRLLLDLQPQQVLALLDLSYVEDVLNGEEALALLRDHLPTRALREGVLLSGY